MCGTRYIKMNFYFILIIIFFNNDVLALNSEVNMISDVLTFYNRPSRVLVRACWPPPTKKSFITELNGMNSPKQIQFIEDVDQMPNNFEPHMSIIIADANCTESWKFLVKANMTNKFRSPYSWIIMTKSSDNNNKKILKDLKDFHLLIDSEVLIADKKGDTFTLYMPYKLQSNNSDWKIESFGTWTLEHRLNKTMEMSSGLSIRRRNLEHLAVATSIVITNNNTKKHLFSLKDPHIDLVSKAGVRQLMPLYQFLNATPVLVFTNTWGYFDNGTVNGMLGDLLSGRTEIGGTVIFLTRERIELLEFLSVPSIPGVKFVFRKPSLTYDNNLFIMPFTPMVWCSLLGILFLIFAITYINALWEGTKMKYKDDQQDRSILRPDLSETAMMVIGAVTQQGSYTELKGTLGRVVMFMTLFVFLFFYTSYSAYIVALLQSSSNQIKTLSDLLNSNLELGVEDTPYNRFFFSTETDPIKKAIYEKKIAPRGSKPNFMTLNEGVLRVQKRPFAFNMFLGSGYIFLEKYFLEHEKCGLQEIQYLDQITLWQTCRKNSPFKELYKLGLMRNVENGINTRESRLLFGKKPSCTSGGGNFDSVYMRDFYPALLILVYGTVLSIIILILEHFYWKRSQ